MLKGSEASCIKDGNHRRSDTLANVTARGLSYLLADGSDMSSDCRCQSYQSSRRYLHVRSMGRRLRMPFRRAKLHAFEAGYNLCPASLGTSRSRHKSLLSASFEQPMIPGAIGMTLRIFVPGLRKLSRRSNTPVSRASKTQPSASIPRRKFFKGQAFHLLAIPRRYVVQRFCRAAVTNTKEIPCPNRDQSPSRFQTSVFPLSPDWPYFPHWRSGPRCW